MHVDKAGVWVYNDNHGTPIRKGAYMVETEAQKRARLKYEAKQTVQVKMKLNTKTDADILAKLDSVSNKQGYIKELIRKDLKRP